MAARYCLPYYHWLSTQNSSLSQAAPAGMLVGKWQEQAKLMQAKTSKPHKVLAKIIYKYIATLKQTMNSRTTAAALHGLTIKCNKYAPDAEWCFP